ncbi:MFS transporter, partial [Candidatus Riflebacteria bacterium]
MDNNQNSFTENQKAALLAITVTQFSVPFMLSSVGVALPTIGLELKASAMDLTLLETIFMATTAIFLLPAGKLGDIHGRARIFFTGLFLFTLVTFLIPLFSNIRLFIFFRALQGVGGALEVATGLAILADVFPPARRGHAIGITTAGVYAGLTAGPFIGGFLTSFIGWRWLFYSGGVLTFLALLTSIRLLKLDSITTADKTFDYSGALLIMAAIAAIVSGSSHFKEDWAKAVFLLGLFLLALFIFFEKKQKNPLIRVQLFFENRPFTLGIFAQFINYSATFGVTFLMSLFLQNGCFLSAHKAGLILVSRPIIMTIFSPVFGKLCESKPPRFL